MRKRNKNDGFSYIEVVMAMAILSIIIIPILSALNQAILNHQFAVLRHKAQGQAVTLALEVRRSSDNIDNILQQFAANNGHFGYKFIYRVSLVYIGSEGSSRHYTLGDETLIPEHVQPNFQTQAGFENLFTSGMFVTAEVFDSTGNLAGFSVGKVN